jgi:cell division protein FtsN
MATTAVPAGAPAAAAGGAAAAAVPAATTVASAAPATTGTASAAAASQGLAGLRYLQAGLFSDPINAITMREQLNGLGIGNVQLKNDTRNGASVSRVLIGPFLDDDTLAAVRKRLLDLRLPAVPVVE